MKFSRVALIAVGMALFAAGCGSEGNVFSLEEGCTDRFEDAIGTPYADSLIYRLPIYPSEDSFGQGDKEVVCYGVEVDENNDPTTRTGSILDSGL